MPNWSSVMLFTGPAVPMPERDKHLPGLLVCLQIVWERVPFVQKVTSQPWASNEKNATETNGCHFLHLFVLCQFSSCTPNFTFSGAVVYWMAWHQKMVIWQQWKNITSCELCISLTSTEPRILSFTDRKISWSVVVYRLGDSQPRSLQQRQLSITI